MRKITSAGANKLIKSLEDEKNFLLSIENSSSTYVLAEGEKTEIPEYDYLSTAVNLNRIDESVRIIKHAINIFNTTTILEPLGITIDESLVKMAQLTARKFQLDLMRKRLPKERQANLYSRTNIIEYQYVNYDLSRVNEDYKQISQQIVDIQLALDTCNQTETFEIDL